MRAMILAAGLGTRMRPLSDLRAKPAMPVRGRPVISLLLELLARQGFREVMINLHYRPESIRAAVAADHPPQLDISWSNEPMPLGTGGGIRRAADFLRRDEACVVLAGDMLLDVDLKGLLERHRASGRGATLLLRDDPRGSDFGTIGANACGEVHRIGTRPIDHSRQGKNSRETTRGLFTGVRFFSRSFLTHWPHEAVFEDLRDWIIPGIETRGERVGIEITSEASSVWEPVGTPAEYLRVNLSPPALPSLGGSVENWTGEVEIGGAGDVILSRKASVPIDADLRRCVVWDGEELPAGFQGHDGVYAGGAFRTCLGTPGPSEVAGSNP